MDVNHLCKKFQIGKTLLYEIAKQNYGIGIAEHIRNLRIEKAKELLTEIVDYLHNPQRYAEIGAQIPKARYW